MVGKIQHSEATCPDTGRRSQCMGTNPMTHRVSSPRIFHDHPPTIHWCQNGRFADSHVRCACYSSGSVSLPVAVRSCMFAHVLSLAVIVLMAHALDTAPPYPHSRRSLGPSTLVLEHVQLPVESAGVGERGL